ncbi:MAG TPA: histidine kinase dimerization/phospho-acceptor domain-containing protein, partial [Isosphaeraceae bacterium]|nr:histidine kinase dimerization/phospho-acceptor domain-containing protein [Isosphaeraceae bacterium]
MQLVSQPRRSELPPSRSELQFRRLLEKLPAAAYTCACEGVITVFNTRAVQLWGREPKLNDPVDRFCGSFKLFSADGTPIRHDQCWMALTLQENKEYNGEEIIVERPDGSRLTVLAHANPVYDELDKLAGAVNVLVDITDRKRNEDALREADRRKDEFLAILAHELRNPLAPIRNALQLLRLDGGNGATLEHARTLMERQLQQMVRLVDDLMDASRISCSKLELRIERVDLAAVVQSAVESSRPLIEAWGHELVISLPEQPIYLDADVT